MNCTHIRLGRKAIKTDSRTLRLSRYLIAKLPPPPISCDWTKGIAEWGMMHNDTLGDCTCAGRGHGIQVWSANLGKEVTISDADVLTSYEQWCGYDPNDPATDQGGIELDILNDWKKKGLKLDGHTLLAFANSSVSNVTELKQAISIFGGLYIGMNVPCFIMNDIPQLWDVVADDGGIDGGHCVWVCGYDASTVTFISWGSIYKMTWAYWHKYVDEAHCLLSPDWLAANGAPSGFNLVQLKADLAAIR